MMKRVQNSILFLWVKIPGQVTADEDAGMKIGIDKGWAVW